MIQVNLRSLIDKLNVETKAALEGAAGLCLGYTHYDIEIEHWLQKMFESTTNDIAKICHHYGVDSGRLSSDITLALKDLKTGNSRPPALSPRIIELSREAWLVASLNYSASKSRTGHVLLALLTDDTLGRIATSISREFRKISPEALKSDLMTIVSSSSESTHSDDVSQKSEETALKGSGKSTVLDQFTVNLTRLAEQGKIDPILGRDKEVRQIVDILTRRRQNNPILTGEAGVGKTAVVEGFALRVFRKDVPPQLQNVEIRTLDLGLLQAGASVKGEFENRLRGVIDEVKASATPIILFIDEAHTLIGAGGQAGQNDAANLLKPALARGELRTIAATTWSEYKKYFEKDPALTRRFQVVKVEEPDETTAIEMMRGIATMLERHHKVRILDEAVIEAVKLSHRYIPDRQLPDKSVSVLDTACARVGISQSSTPEPIETCQKRLEQITSNTSVFEKEVLAGINHTEQLAALAIEKAQLESKLSSLTAQWEKEIHIVREIGALLQNNSGIGADSEGTEADDRYVKQIRLLEQELKFIQADAPLVHAEVNQQTVAEVIAAWTGIPVGRMMRDDIQAILSLKERLENRVIGQSHALEAIAKSIRTSRAKLTDPNKPIGVFLMVGTSGVGKTETALALAELLYGGEQNITTINMSEFKEEHKVSLLMGSPPGYVGYGEGGVLTEAVRRKPYSIVLLDEMEKAHPGVQDVFYQVFDKGTMKDGEGRDIDFKNTIIIMTSNLGTETISKLCLDPEMSPEPENLLEAVTPDLQSYFKPAFLGRVTSVVYYPLHDEALNKIIKLKLNKIKKRVAQNYNAKFNYSDSVVEFISSRCQELDSGARLIDNLLNDSLLPQMATDFLVSLSEGKSVSGVDVSLNEEGNAFLSTLLIDSTSPECDSTHIGLTHESISMNTSADTEA